MQIYSASVKVVKKPGLGTSQTRPVFGEQDKIEGKVSLDPTCSHNGRLTISVRVLLPSLLFRADRGSAGRGL